MNDTQAILFGLIPAALILGGVAGWCMRASEYNQLTTAHRIQTLTLAIRTHQVDQLMAHIREQHQPPHPLFDQHEAEFFHHLEAQMRDGDA